MRAFLAAVFLAIGFIILFLGLIPCGAGAGQCGDGAFQLFGFGSIAVAICILLFFRAKPRDPSTTSAWISKKWWVIVLVLTSPMVLLVLLLIFARIFAPDLIQ